MAAYYDLDESEVSEVTGSGKTTNKVESIVSDAADLQTENAENFFSITVEESLVESDAENKRNKQSETDEQQVEETDQDEDEIEDDTDDDTGQTGLNEFM
jgi:replication factor C large subunit